MKFYSLAGVAFINTFSADEKRAKTYAAFMLHSSKEKAEQTFREYIYNQGNIYPTDIQSIELPLHTPLKYMFWFICNKVHMYLFSS